MTIERLYISGKATAAHRGHLHATEDEAKRFIIESDWTIIESR